MDWKIARRSITLDRPLVMGILNVTPDSFSDGGKFLNVDDALRHAEQLIAEGADIIDIGGESTRPGSSPVDAATEIARTQPVAAAIVKRFDVPLSIDTSKPQVAKALIDAGCEIINDISGLRWEPSLAEVAAGSGAGLVVMHSLGEFEKMHGQEPVSDIIKDVVAGLRRSIETAHDRGVDDDQIVIDPGIGFGKSLDQNLEILRRLGDIITEFDRYPLLIGTSRKSFIGKILNGAPVEDRLGGSLASALFALSLGARVLRVHDVKETTSAIRTLRAIMGS